MAENVTADPLFERAEGALVPTVIGVSIGVLVLLANTLVLYLIMRTEKLKKKVVQSIFTKQF